MTILKAIEAGADIVGCALSPMANGQRPAPSRWWPPAGTDTTPAWTGLLVAGLQGVSNAVDAPESRTLWRGSNAYYRYGFQQPADQLEKAERANQLEEVLQEVPARHEKIRIPPMGSPPPDVGSRPCSSLSPRALQEVTRRARRCCAVNTPLPAEWTGCAGSAIGDDEVNQHRPADDIPPELDKYRE